MACTGFIISDLAACTTAGPLPTSTISDTAAAPITAAAVPITTPTVQGPADTKYFPSDEPLHMGLEYFNRGQFGLAEQYFRDAVTKAPKDPLAWLGLAASYDRTGRFDLADRAYKVTRTLVGETPELLNNEGYSFMLRGDLKTAQKKFQRAYTLDPNNPAIANNLKLLNSSKRYIRRAPNHYEPNP
jgi:Flp pilus assembly protein TadD